MQIANTIYTTSGKIENNTVLNRSIMDIGGFEAPYIYMSNNSIERKERIAKASLYFSGAFLSPLLILPLLNRSFLLKSGVTKKFWSKEAHIIRLSNKFLSSTSPEMQKGINELGEKMKLKDEFKNVLKRFESPEKLRQAMIKAKSNVLWADILVTTLLLGSVPWYINKISKLITKRAGYTGEFKLADKEYSDKQTEHHEKNKGKKMTAVLGLVMVNSLLWPNILKKAMLKPTNEGLKGISKLFRKNSQWFDYTDGIFMSRMTYFLLEAFGDTPSCIAATRDKHEMRSTCVQLAVSTALFFGGDFLLNNLFGRFFDHKFGTKLMNRKDFPKETHWAKMLLMPVHHLNTIEKLKNESVDVIKRTKKFALGMYWGNFAIIMLALGFGVPFIMNKIMRTKVKEDLAKRDLAKNSTTEQTLQTNILQSLIQK